MRQENEIDDEDGSSLVGNCGFAGKLPNVGNGVDFCRRLPRRIWGLCGANSTRSPRVRHGQPPDVGLRPQSTCRGKQKYRSKKSGVCKSYRAPMSGAKRPMLARMCDHSKHQDAWHLS